MYTEQNSVHCALCNIWCALRWHGLTCAVQLGRMDKPSIKLASQLINIITITFLMAIIRDMITFVMGI